MVGSRGIGNDHTVTFQSLRVCVFSMVVCRERGGAITHSRAAVIHSWLSEVLMMAVTVVVEGWSRVRALISTDR